MDHTGAPTTPPWASPGGSPQPGPSGPGPSGPPAYGTPPVPPGHPPYGYGPPGYPPPVLPGAPPPLPPGTPPPWGPPQPTGPGWQLVLLVIGAALTGIWIVVGTTLLQLVGWFGADVADGTGSPVTGVLWFVLAWLNAALIALPAGLIWLLARLVRPRPEAVVQTARAWTLAGLAAGVVGTPRAVPTPHNELLLLLTAMAALGLALFYRGRPPGRGVGVGVGVGLGGIAWGVTAGLAALLPWLWAGTLGGLTETILAVLAAAAVGRLAAALMDGRFFSAFARSRVLLVLVGGPVAGVTLAALGSAVGGRGVNLFVVAVLPALGIAAAGLAAWATPDRLGWAPVTAMVGVAALGPLAFVDPEETSLILGFSDMGYWALVAGLLSVLTGLVVGVAYGAGLRGSSRPVAAAVTALAVLAAAGVYVVTGRPGFYGERLFVVMAEQADLSGLDAIADRTTRVRTTYQRLVEQARKTQAPLIDQLRRWHLSYTPYYLVNGVLVDGGPAVRQWLATRSDVDRVLLDPQLRPLPVGQPTTRGPETDIGSVPQWNIKLIEADRVWNELGVQGQGIVIGTSDSGVDGAHPALKDGFRGGDDSWLDPWNGTAAPTDHGGHGTHTMGTAAGRGGIGVAPAAQWIGCVNLDRNAASPSRYLDCLQFMLAPYPAGADPLTAGRPERAPQVLTNSWGCPGIEGCDLDSLRPAIAALDAAGIFFVAAAGNSGPSCRTVADPPAPYTETFTVGAVDEDGVVTSFSSRGPTPDGRVKPDIMAPGANVLSAMPDDTYGHLDGTSMATPHVAGVVALMWSANPKLIGDIGTTERILRETATRAQPGLSEPICGAPQNIVGAGLVNAYAAVAAAQKAA